MKTLFIERAKNDIYLKSKRLIKNLKIELFPLLICLGLGQIKQAGFNP